MRRLLGWWCELIVQKLRVFVLEKYNFENSWRVRLLVLGTLSRSFKHYWLLMNVTERPVLKDPPEYHLHLYINHIHRRLPREDVPTWTRTTGTREQDGTFAVLQSWIWINTLFPSPTPASPVKPAEISSSLCIAQADRPRTNHGQCHENSCYPRTTQICSRKYPKPLWPFDPVCILLFHPMRIPFMQSPNQYRQVYFFLSTFSSKVLLGRRPHKQRIQALPDATAHIRAVGIINRFR